MNFGRIASLALVAVFAAPTATAGIPSLVGELPSGKLLHVMVPAIESDMPDKDAWAEISQVELMMTINIFETSDKKVLNFYQKQPCEFARGKYLACGEAGGSRIAGTRYELNPATLAYDCKSGCTKDVPALLRVRAPIVFDQDADGALLIDQHP